MKKENILSVVAIILSVSIVVAARYLLDHPMSSTEVLLMVLIFILLEITTKFYENWKKARKKPYPE